MMGSRKIGNHSSWSDLPQELLQIIADGLGNKSDVSRFRSVCESWRSSVPPFKQPLTFPLKIPQIGSMIHSHPNSVSLLSQSTLYHLSDPSSSSSLPRLVKVREHPGQRQTHVLVNPLSPLPVNPLPESFPRLVDSSKLFHLAEAYALQFADGTYCNYRVALSSDRDVVVVVVGAGILLALNLCQRQEERVWRVVNDMASQLSYEDVVLFGSRLCAVNELGRAVEVDPRSTRVSEIASPFPGPTGDKKRLVVSAGDLLLVDAYRYRTRQSIKMFRVYRLDENGKRWEELFALEDRVVLLGYDGSVSIEARGHGNCIVFRDPRLMVFTLGKKRVSPLEKKPEYAEMFSTWIPRFFTH